MTAALLAAVLLLLSGPERGGDPGRVGVETARYRVEAGKVVDAYPGKTDEEVLAAIEATQVALTTPLAEPTRVITKLAFMNRFTMEELAAIYTAAKTEVMVEVFLDKLKIAEEVNLADAQTIGGLQALAASGLLTEARVQEVLQ